MRRRIRDVIAPPKPRFDINVDGVLIAKMTHVVLLGPARICISLAKTMGVFLSSWGDFALVLMPIENPTGNGTEISHVGNAHPREYQGF